MITIIDDSKSIHITARLARELTSEELIAVFQQNRDRRAVLETVTTRLPMNRYELEADRLMRISELEAAISEQERLRDRCVKSKSRTCLAEALQTIEQLRNELYKLTKPPPVPVMRKR